jgi:hypothetical protein
MIIMMILLMMISMMMKPSTKRKFEQFHLSHLITPT